MSKHCLVVGQGIAGTLLAWCLKRGGAQVTLADVPLPGRSTVAAAGIINPVTGRRFVKSWRFEEFYPVAKHAYAELGRELGADLWEDRPVVRLLSSPEECNEWSVRCAQAEYAPYLSETGGGGAWQEVLRPGFRFGLTAQAARVDLPLLLSLYRKKAAAEGFLLEEHIPVSAAGAQHHDHVVFCEGWRAAYNPFFPEAPFELSKGEALLFRFKGRDEGFAPGEMLKKTLLVAPLGGGLFWAGSTYGKGDRSAEPTAEGRAYLMRHLGEMFAVPTEVVGHVAGVRPTTRDRRPRLEQSPADPRMFMLNGLGTKGALLAPFFAQKLAERLLG